MNFSKSFLAITVSATLFSLSGCGVTTQDEGLGDGAATPFSGVAIDGYVARAVVFTDVNENNKLDAWESRALTDGRGYFTYSPAYTDSKGNAVAAVNYCDLPSSNAKHVHCLKAPAGYDEVLVRLTKGYDLATAEPFTGSLSMRVKVSNGNVASPIAATPITTLLSYMSESEVDAFLVANGLVDDQNNADLTLASSDFLDFSNSLTEQNRLALVSMALKIHKAADLISIRQDVAFDQDGTDSDTGFFGVAEQVGSDASQYSYKALADTVKTTANASSSLSTLMQTQAEMNTVAGDTWDNIKQVITDYNTRKTENLAEGEQAQDLLKADQTKAADYNSLATDVNRLATATDNLFSTSLDATAPEEDFKARLKAVNIYSAILRDLNFVNDANRAARITTAESAMQDAAYLTNLRSPKVDVAGLIKKFKDGNYNSAADADYSTRKSFKDLLGEASTGLTGTNTEGLAGNSLSMDDNGDSVGIAFTATDAEGNPDPDATSGTMEINALFSEGDFAVPKKDENGNEVKDAQGNTVYEETTLTGTWEQLDEYTMLMNVEVAGVTQPVIVKPTLDENGNPAYYYDMGGEQQLWTPGQ